MTLLNSSLVSVILPVCNGEKYISESIDSILTQSYENIELVIINDGSTDKTKDIILSKYDKKIIYVENKKNQGIAKSLNKMIGIAKGDFIARMDSDDISFNDRIEKQVLFLSENKEVDIVGAQIDILGDKNRLPSATYLTSDEIRVNLLRGNVLFHPTVVFRKRAFKKANLRYDKSALHAEDYKLWADASVNGLVIENLSIPLLYYRVHPDQISEKKRTEQYKTGQLIKICYGSFFFNEILDGKINSYLNLISGRQLPGEEAVKIKDLARAMKIKNDKELFFNKHVFYDFIDKCVESCSR